MKRMVVFVGAAACLFLLAGGDARAGGRHAAMGNTGSQEGNGVYVNLIVREVKVTPVRAHVGDTIRVDAVIQNTGEGRGTTRVKLYANGKEVAGKWLSWGETEDRVYRETFLWDTKGTAPGEYRIRAEAFVWEDASYFDNDMTVKEPVTLVAAGAAFPGGGESGGEAVAVDPRWHPGKPSLGGGSRNSAAPSGIVAETASRRRQ